MATAERKATMIPMKTGFPVADQQLNATQTFPRSKKLKNEGVVMELTLEQEIEYMKCSMDPVYFAKNYYKITSIDKGFMLFEPFEYQEELLEAFNEHRFVIDMQCRQSGKCVRGDTEIKVRKISTGEIEETTIEKFHNGSYLKERSKPSNVSFAVWRALWG